MMFRLKEHRRIYVYNWKSCSQKKNIKQSKRNYQRKNTKPPKPIRKREREREYDRPVIWYHI